MPVSLMISGLLTARHCAMCRSSKSISCGGAAGAAGE
jgi:hypothetical protein